ncbi:extracellular solute-binding protein [bacterium]|nr:extracellular solute-binding protein [bacterium]
MKKSVLTIIILIFVAFGLFAWIKTDKVHENKSEELVFWTLQLGTFSDYITPIIKEFENKHPGIKVSWVDIPYSEGGKRTLAAIMSDNPPDLINATPDFSTLLAQKNTLYTYKDSEQYLPSVMQSLTTDGGKTYYAIPFYATTAITFYNTALTDKMGLKDIPKTYEQMYALSKTALEKTNAYITMPTINENDTFLKILNKYDLATPENINSKSAVELVNGYKELYQKDFIPKESLTQTHRESLEKYMSGQIVFYNGGGNFLNLIKENAPDIYEKTDVSTQITGKNGKYDFSLMNLIIPKNAKHKELAVEFAKLLTNEEHQLEFAKITTVMPVNKYTLENEYFTDEQNDIQSKTRVLSAKQLKNALPPIADKDFKGLINITNKTIAEIILDKTNTQKGLDDLKTWWEKH